jgi:hypothetical protein
MSASRTTLFRSDPEHPSVFSPIESKSASVSECGVSPRWIFTIDARARASGSGM